MSSLVIEKDIQHTGKCRERRAISDNIFNAHLDLDFQQDVCLMWGHSIGTLGLGSAAGYSV